MTTTDIVGVAYIGQEEVPLFANGHTDNTTEENIAKQDPSSDQIGKNNKGKRLTKLVLATSVGSILDYIRIKDSNGNDKFKFRCRESNLPLVIIWKDWGSAGLLLDDGDILCATTSD